ncbi:hypothetical protein PROFUN_14897 [Planoprotostelium fungivorum]|uniref:Uncharacterized protein n=1 Tax=Planoprotostelium fungivorum TaxID=1890364 RepID=A0A2P6MY72_9EUKA|nr:hypothetical protein PROFUN_14897 [Planoprotostelium fungivorum]
MATNQKNQITCRKLTELLIGSRMSSLISFGITGSERLRNLALNRTIGSPGIDCGQHMGTGCTGTNSGAARLTRGISTAAAIWLLNEAENAELALYRTLECFEYNFLLISFNTLFDSCVSSFCCPISLVLFVYTRGKSIESQPTALAVYLYGIHTDPHADDRVNPSPQDNAAIILSFLNFCWIPLLFIDDKRLRRQ